MRAPFGRFVKLLALVGAALFAAPGANRSDAQCVLQLIRDPSPLAAEHFGSSVRCSANGRIAIGAPEAHDPGSGIASGAVYVFRKDSAGLHCEAQLLPGGGLAAVHGGRALAIDAQRLAIGLPENRSVELYERSGDAWALEAVITPPGLASNTEFGAAVSLAQDVLVVGCPYYKKQPDTAGGAAFVYRRVGAQWQLAQTLVKPGASFQLDRIGTSVATDGRVLLVGNPRADDQDQAGEVLAYELEGGSFVARPPLVGLAQAGGSFGRELALERGLAVIGAPREFDLVGGFAAGAVYVFAQLAGEWRLNDRLTAPTPAPGKQFGSALASGASMFAASEASGAVHVFRKLEGVWSFAGSSATGSGSGDRLALAENTLFAGDEWQAGGNGVVRQHDLALGVSGQLLGTPHSLALASGGSVQLLFDGCASLAGSAYALLGSTSPGSGPVLCRSTLLPFALDSVSLWLLANLENPAVCDHCLGLLDAQGDAQLALHVPASVGASALGLQLQLVCAILPAAAADCAEPSPVLKLGLH